MPLDRMERVRRRGTGAVADRRIVVASGMAGTGTTLVASALQSGIPHCDVVDAGACWVDIAEACAPGFARLFVVTTHDVVAVSAAYALVKLVRGRYPESPVEILVNRSSERDALRTYERIQGAASHFLGETVAYAGAVPDGGMSGDAASEDGRAEEQDAVKHLDGEPVGAALRALAARLDDELDTMAGRAVLRAAERRRTHP